MFLEGRNARLQAQKTLETKHASLNAEAITQAVSVALEILEGQLTNPDQSQSQEPRYFLDKR